MFLDQKNATDPMSLKDQRHRVVDARMKAKTVQNSQQIVHSKKIKNQNSDISVKTKRKELVRQRKRFFQRNLP